MQWDGNDRALYLFHEYTTYNIKISLPYLEINPANKAGKKEEYTITAVSTGVDGTTVNCTEKLTFLYQFPWDSSIIKTGLREHVNLTVDSPDQLEIDLTREFYGKNLTYNITFESNSSIFPKHYVDKIHPANMAPIEGLNISNIVWFEMFE